MKEIVNELGAPNFYIACDDLTYYRGKINEMKLEYETFREYSEKFVSDPVLALINVIYYDHQESNKPENRKKLFENLKFDSTTNSYQYDEYLTIGSRLPAKSHHMKLFLSGEYELIKIHHDIQILKTDLVNIDLDSIKKEIFND